VYMVCLFDASLVHKSYLWLKCVVKYECKSLVKSVSFGFLL